MNAKTTHKLAFMLLLAVMTGYVHCDSTGEDMKELTSPSGETQEARAAVGENQPQREATSMSTGVSEEEQGKSRGSSMMLTPSTPEAAKEAGASQEASAPSQGASMQGTSQGAPIVSETHGSSSHEAAATTAQKAPYSSESTTLGQKAHNAKEGAKDTASDATQYVKEKAHDAKEGTGNLFEGIRNWWNSLWSNGSKRSTTGIRDTDVNRDVNRDRNVMGGATKTSDVYPGVAPQTNR